MPVKSNMAQKTETIIFSIGFFYRLCIFLALIWWSEQAGFDYPLLGSDARGYWNLAHNIVTKYEFYTEDERFAALRRPPGYPVFLGAFQILPIEKQTAQYATSLVQILLASISAVLLYRLLRQFASERIATGAAFFFALEPNSAYYSTLILSDALFVFLFIAFTYMFLAKETCGAFFYAGLLLGISMLVRPITQFFPAIAILFLLYARGIQRKTIVQCAAFCIGTLLFTLPWMMRNGSVAGSFDISSSGSNTYYRYVMPSFVSWRTGEPHAALQEEFIARFDVAAAQNINAVTFMQKETIRIISDAPLPYAFYHAIKTAPFFLGDGIREILQKTELLHAKQPNISSEFLSGNILKVTRLAMHDKYLLIALAGGIFWSIIFILAVVGFFHSLREKSGKRACGIFFAAAILYFALLTGPATSTRHRMPALPFIAGLAAMGFYEFSDRRKLGYTKYISSTEFAPKENQSQT